VEAIYEILFEARRAGERKTRQNTSIDSKRKGGYAAKHGDAERASNPLSSPPKEPFNAANTLPPANKATASDVATPAA
jgi:hypothetical protein